MENKQNRWSIVLTIVVLILAVAVGVLAVQVMKLKKQSDFGSIESTTEIDNFNKIDKVREIEIHY